MSEEATEEVSNERLRRTLGENYSVVDDESQQSPKYLINRAERIINEQERKIETLSAQVNRYEQIKIGIIVLVGLFGLSNIGRAIEFGLTELMPLVLWFILVLMTMVSSSIYLRELSPILGHHSPTVSNLATPHDNLIEQLDGMREVAIEDQGRKVGEIVDEIYENHKRIDDLNHQLRYSYYIIFTAFFILIISKIPGLVRLFA